MANVKASVTIKARVVTVNDKSDPQNRPALERSQRFMTETVPVGETTPTDLELRLALAAYILYYGIE